jgi:hypothetical protein
VLNANDEWCELNGMFLEKTRGVLDYWSTGVLEKLKTVILLFLLLALLQHSITPVAV